jgi:hypothetical protein
VDTLVTWQGKGAVQQQQNTTWLGGAAHLCQLHERVQCRAVQGWGGAGWGGSHNKGGMLQAPC